MNNLDSQNQNQNAFQIYESNSASPSTPSGNHAPPPAPPTTLPPVLPPVPPTTQPPAADLPFPTVADSQTSTTPSSFRLPETTTVTGLYKKNLHTQYLQYRNLLPLPYEIFQKMVGPGNSIKTYLLYILLMFTDHSIGE